MSDCGTCSMCCKVMGIADLEPVKPVNQWCPHCPTKKGCGIYDTRPTSCREFECLWLYSQHDEGEALDLSLRPDKTKVVIVGTEDPNMMHVHVDPAYPLAWREGATGRMIENLANRGIKMVIGHGPTTEKIMLDKPPGWIAVRKRTIQFTPPDATGYQEYVPTA